MPGGDEDRFAIADIAGSELFLVPATNFSGTLHIVVEGSDSGGQSNTSAVEVEILPVADPPQVGEIPDLVVAGDGSVSSFELGRYFTDVDDDDQLTFGIISNSNPAIFPSVDIDPATGRLRAEPAPFVSGYSSMVIRAVDSAGLSVTTTFKLVLPVVAQPVVTIPDELVLNRQTGLYEHQITVTNPALRSIGGVALTISSLPDGAEVYNASGQIDGDTWLVQHGVPIGPGATIDIVLEYYSPERTIATLPEIAAQPILPVPARAGDGVGAFAIDRAVAMPDGSILIEFQSDPGACYAVQFSSDNQIWHESPIRIRSAGTRIQWIDRGAPKTPTPPTEVGLRFYRAVKKE